MVPLVLGVHFRRRSTVSWLGLDVEVTAEGAARELMTLGDLHVGRQTGRFVLLVGAEAAMLHLLLLVEGRLAGH